MRRRVVPAPAGRSARPTLALALTLLLASGCEPEPSDRPSSPADRPSSRDVAVITPEGVGCARIGDSVDTLRAACDVVADTVLVQEGMEQSAVVLRVGGADVLAEVVEGRVWRLSVPGTGPRTDDGVGVGTPFHTLADRLDVDVYAGEGRYFAVPSGRCGLSFELEGVPFDGAAPSTETLVERGSEVRISRVLVLGC